MMQFEFSIAKFRRDRRGVSALEFALVAPIMIAFYFGMSEFAQAFMAQKRTGHVASSIADLVAQDESVTAAEFDDIFAAGSTLMLPYSTSGMRQRLSSVTVDSSGTARVDWSRASNWTPLGTGSAVTLPDGLVANGESLIVSEVEFPYQSPIEAFLPGQTLFNRSYYLRPRLVDRVAAP